MELKLNMVVELTKEIEKEEQRLGNLRDGVERITRGYEESVGGKRYRSKIDELVTLIVEAEEHLRDLYDARLVARINLLAVIRQAKEKLIARFEEIVAELRKDCRK